MFMNVLLLLSALSLSCISGYYSVLGMASIFSASFVPIVIMTGALETSKLIVASWLYNNWSKTPFMLKTYLCVAVIVLMMITSLGVFGFLSKAHISQTLGSQDNTLIINQIDQEIQQQQSQITDAQSQISELDSSVNSLLKQNYAIRSSKLRIQQQPERDTLSKQILSADTQITNLNNQKIQLEQVDNKTQADIGPLLYIAQMLYGDNVTPTLQEHAVRIVILMIIFVFDPLAVLSVIAANLGFAHYKNSKIEEYQAPKGDHSAIVSKVELPELIKKTSTVTNDELMNYYAGAIKKINNSNTELEPVYPNDNPKPVVREPIVFENTPVDVIPTPVDDDILKKIRNFARPFTPPGGKVTGG
jgi:hypothetical protein